MVIHRPARVFGLGQCSLDYIGRIDVYPPPDTKCEAGDLVIESGGPVATALVALSRWNVPCAFCGLIGDDSFGIAIRESLAREGIDTRDLIVSKGGQSQFAFIASEPAHGGRRTIFWRRPTGSPLKPSVIDEDKLRGARVLHTDGLWIDASLSAAGAAKKAGVTVVVDAGTLREGMLELARLSDCFIASESFSRALTRGGTPRDACRLLAELGPKVAGITLGAAGYVALSGGHLIERPAYPVAAVDTTGCGDVFHAGFIYGHLQGWRAEKSLDFAAWAASRVSLKPGGRAGIPTLGEMKKNGYESR